MPPVVVGFSSRNPSRIHHQETSPSRSTFFFFLFSHWFKQNGRLRPVRCESQGHEGRREPIFAASWPRLPSRTGGIQALSVGIWNCTLSETCPVFQSRKNCLATSDVLKHSVEILKKKEVVRPVPAQGYTRENPEATKAFNTWNTHSKFKIAPEKWWLEDDPFLLGFGHFSGATC